MILFADECVPPKHFRALGQELEAAVPPVQCIHLLDRLKSGAADDEVVVYLRTLNPRPIVLSSDSGRNTKRGDPRLPVLLPQCGITSVIFSPAAAQIPGLAKMAAIREILPRLREIAAEHEGLRYRLSPVLLGDSEMGHWVLREWPLKA